MNFKPILAAAVLLGASAASAATNLVVNGGFELTTNGPDKSLYLSSTAPIGWTVQNPNASFGFIYSAPTLTTSADTTGAIDPQRSDPAQLWGPGNGTANGLVAYSPTGGNFLALDADPDYAPLITQDLTGLLVGHTYKVSFDWAAAQFKTGTLNWNGPTYEKVVVGFGAQSQSTDTVQIASHGFSPWVAQSFSFIAQNATQTLSFLGSGGPGGLPPAILLDSVRVAAVPEPATWAMTVIGFFGIGIMVRRRTASRSTVAA